MEDPISVRLGHLCMDVVAWVACNQLKCLSFPWTKDHICIGSMFWHIMWHFHFLNPFTKLCDLLGKQLHSLCGVAEDDALREESDNLSKTRNFTKKWGSQLRSKYREWIFLSTSHSLDGSGEYRKVTHHKRNLSRQTQLVNQVRPFVGHHVIPFSYIGILSGSLP